ncbi:MAG: hypothetical protein ACKVJK_14680, partial [Methylophagaceae bacterium]
LAARTATGNIAFYSYDGGWSETARFTNTGNLGIGVTPVTLKSATTLQVLGNIKAGAANGSGLISLGDIASTGANAGIWRGAAGAYAGVGNFLNLGGYDGITFTTGNADIASQTERMRIQSNGLIAFSKTATTGTAVATINHSSNDFLYINGGTAGASFGDDNQSTRMICYNNDYIRFDSAAVERMRLTPDGNNTFLIIKAKPATYNSKSFLTLYGTNSSTYGGSVIARSSISSETDGSAYGANLKFYTNDSSNVEQTRMLIDSSGNVGIGTTAPTQRLQLGVNGSLIDSIRIGNYAVAKNTRQYIGYTRADSGLFETTGNGDTPSTVLAGVAGVRIVNTAGIITSSAADNSVQLLTHIYNGGSRVALHASY